MKTILFSLFISLSINVYSQTVTTIDQVKTKPGQFDDYITFLEKNWVIARQKAKEKGYIISFKYSVNRQDTLSDVSLVTEYRDDEAYKNRENIFKEIYRETFPNGPILVNNKRSKDMAEIISSKEIKKTSPNK